MARDTDCPRIAPSCSASKPSTKDVRGVDPDRLHCFVDYTLARGYIGWPVSGVHGITQIGLALRRPLRPDLAAFERKLARVFDFSQARCTGHRGGLIPCGGRVARFAAERVALVGDAAGLVSPLTAGGIHTALESGWRAAHAVADWLQDAGPEPRAGPGCSLRFVWKRALRHIADSPGRTRSSTQRCRRRWRAAPPRRSIFTGAASRIEDDAQTRRAVE